MIIGDSEVNALHYRNGIMSEMDWSKVERAGVDLRDKNILIDDKPMMNINHIHSTSRVLARKGMIDHIYIDYLQLIKSIGKENWNREQEVANMSASLKGLARELDMPVILFAQLNRKVEEQAGQKRPDLWHLRESGAIEQDSDIVIFLYRAERYGFKEYEDGSDATGRGEVIIKKFREGPVGHINFRYNSSITKIWDDEQTDEEAPF
jgi:replicative DNA helicase